LYLRGEARLEEKLRKERGWKRGEYPARAPTRHLEGEGGSEVGRQTREDCQDRPSTRRGGTLIRNPQRRKRGEVLTGIYEQVQSSVTLGDDVVRAGRRILKRRNPDWGTSHRARKEEGL